MCPDCEIAGAGVERNLSFPLHFTDKDNDLNRFVYVETFEVDNEPTTFAIVSEHPFFFKFKKILKWLEKISNLQDFEAKVEFLLQIPDPAENVTISVRNALDSTRVTQSTFNLHSLPRTVDFTYTNKTKLPVADYSCDIPLTLLGEDNFVKVLVCLMLEYKIVIVSRNISSITQSVLAFVQLLYPLEFMFCTIPLLPQQLQGSLNILSAPTPYIIGVTKSLINSFKIPNDVWLVDLDAGTITAGSHVGAESVPDAPAHCVEEFKLDIEKAREIIRQKNENTDGNDEIQDSSLEFSSHLRVCTTRLICSILAGVSAHTRTLRLYPRPVVSVNLRTWLRSLRYDAVRKGYLEFFTMLIRTHAVEYFAERSLEPDTIAFIRIEQGESEIEKLCHPVQGENFLAYDLSTNSTPNSGVCSKIKNSATSDQILEHALNENGGHDNEDNGFDCPPKRLSQEEYRKIMTRSMSSVTSPGAMQANSLFRQLSDEKLLKKPRSAEALENQELLKDVINQILGGQGVSWFSNPSLKKLLEDESYRLFVLTQGSGNNLILIDCETVIYSKNHRITISFLSFFWDNLYKLWARKSHL